VEIGDVGVEYSIADAFSRAWFLPRYEGGRLHEAGTCHLLAQHAASARCFVDVGANLGYFTCLVARLNPRCAVYSFEMDRTNFELLETNVALNGCGNVTTVRAAVASDCGVERYQRLWSQGDSGLALWRAAEPPRRGELATVEAVSLDAFFAVKPSAPDVIKIDVEGAEALVIAGMRTLMRQHRPVLFVEVHPLHLLRFGASARQLAQELVSAGYAVSEVPSGVTDPAATPREVPLDGPLGRNTMWYARPAAA
jgi:FkbM family methyltransferase